MLRNFLPNCVKWIICTLGAGGFSRALEHGRTLVSQIVVVAVVVVVF